MTPPRGPVLSTVLVLAALLGGCTSASSATPALPMRSPGGQASAPATELPGTKTTAAPATPAAGSAAPVPATLGALITALSVEPEHRSGYQRELFKHWIDADGDGCNTRKEVLLAQAAEAPRVGPRCWFWGGAWVSPYDGARVTSIGKLDVDHVVALAEAWRSGAWGWTPQRREAFANDLGVPYTLLAVSSGVDRDKADKEPGEWLPPLASARCGFLADWVAIKTRWALSVDEAERDELLRLAEGCTATPIPAIPTP